MAKIGIDTGGTFTDFLLQDDLGELHLHKVLSTPQAPEIAILKGLKDLAVDIRGLEIIHGSTVATNAILEAKGVKTAYITNKGFADVLAIGRQAREELYNLTPVKRAPFLSADMCLEVDSRHSADGELLVALEKQKIQHLIEQLESLRPEAVAINLLFSFLDSSEELRIENAIKHCFGEAVFISRSSDVLPEYREYERGMTTTLNAMVGPLMQDYLQRLQKHTVGCSLSIMQSSAGTTSARHAGRYPVHLLLSGPAGGLLGAKVVSDKNRLLTFDMGGTSTDVSIIDGEIAYSHQSSIAGYSVGVPMVDMHTIGAGGGSIAKVDDGGMLLVGPQSAGASPGPACYGKGGDLPTVTDANVVLGRILPEYFLGGEFELDRSAAENAIRRLADDLSQVDKIMSVEEVARGIIDIANDHMVRALRVMSVQRGEDPKDYTLVSFGGAGGLHVCALASALEMSHAMVPVNAGVLSALGMLAAQQSRERSRSMNRLLNNCVPSEIDSEFERLAEQAIREIKSSVFSGQFDSDDVELSHDGDSPSRLEIFRSVDLRYRGQSNTLNLMWSQLDALENLFHQKHESNYGHQLDIDVELVNLRVRVTATDFSTATPEYSHAADTGQIERSRHRQQFQLPRWIASELPSLSNTTMADMTDPVPVVKRSSLQVGQRVQGPALIIELSSTTWLAQDWEAEVDAVGNLLLSHTS